MDPLAPMRQRGQAIVLMVGGMIAALAMVALIVDGGNAWAQQRITQNGSDAAADAGATVLAQRLAGNPAAGGDGPTADAAVKVAVDTTIDANEIDLKEAYYTDRCGVLLRPDGTMASGLGDAAVVGAGDLPIDNGVDPVCSTGVPCDCGPRRAIGTKPFSTYIARHVGVNDFTAEVTRLPSPASFRASARAAMDESCTVLPVTFPTTISDVSCDGQNNPVNGPTTEWPKGYTIVPLCKNGPGNVGWLDWTPPAGGASELADAIIPPPAATRRSTYQAGSTSHRQATSTPSR